MADEMSERQVLAEQWRLVGESLRERSPLLFAKLLAMLAASAIDDGGEAELSIAQTYNPC